MGESDLLLGPHREPRTHRGCGTIPMPPMTPTLDRHHGGDEIAVALIPDQGPGTTYWQLDQGRAPSLASS